MRTRSVSFRAAFAVVAIALFTVGCGGTKSDDRASSSTKESTSSVASTTSRGTATTSAAPQVTIDPAKKYTATLDTSEGKIVIALDAANAPVSANNFITLANKGFYNGLTFHRVVQDFVIQGGDPEGNGAGGPGYTVAAEVPKNGYQKGSVAWAKTQAEPAGTAGSQFFIVTADGPTVQQSLNRPPYLYGIIGQVTEGLDVAQKIEALDSGDGSGTPTKKVTINKVTITES